MIISVNPNPSLDEFKALMARTDRLLNKDALNRPSYYASLSSVRLDDGTFFKIIGGDNDA